MNQDHTLSSVLPNKLPPDFHLIVSRKVSADDLNMDKILETFELEPSARERANSHATPAHHCSRQQEHIPTLAIFANTPKSAFCRQTYSSIESLISTLVRKH